MEDKVIGVLEFGSATIRVKSIQHAPRERFLIIENAPACLAYLMDASNRFYLDDNGEFDEYDIIYGWEPTIVGNCSTAEENLIELIIDAEYSNNLISAFVNILGE